MSYKKDLGAFREKLLIGVRRKLLPTHEAIAKVIGYSQALYDVKKIGDDEKLEIINSFVKEVTK